MSFTAYVSFSQRTGRTKLRIGKALFQKQRRQACLRKREAV